jgi:hypothetical protein
MINPLADADVAQVIEIVRRSPHASRGAVSRLQAAAAMNTRLRAKAARRVQDGPSRDRESPDAC